MNNTYPLQVSREQALDIRSVAVQRVRDARSKCRQDVGNAFTVDGMLEATNTCVRNYTEASSFLDQIDNAIKMLDKS
jgi:hypothetical protein